MSREMINTGIEWIGEMPRHWKLGKVKHVFYRSKEVNNTENPTVLSLARSGIRERDISTNEGQLAASYDKYNVVKAGDLLLNPMDLISGANCNLSYVEGVISPAYVNLRKKREGSSKFYDYFFKLQYWQKAFFAHGKGVSFENRWTLNNETLMNYTIPLPATNEQYKIANFLDEKTAEIDSIIENTKKSIVELEKYKQSLINEIVTKGLNPGVELKDSGIEWFGEIPVHWEISKLGRIFKVILGKMLSPEPKELDWSKERYISAANVHFDGVDTSNLKKMWFSPSEKKNLEVKYEDLLIVEGGAGAGGSSLYLSEEQGIYVQNSINIVRSKDKYGNTRFAYYLMHCLVKNGFIDYICSKATFAHFTKEKVQSVPYPVIPIDEQQQIVRYLDEKTGHIDRLIHQKEQLIEEIEEYKKSLIYEYVTGKKEVM